jgi:hypothetical protein
VRHNKDSIACCKTYILTYIAGIIGGVLPVAIYFAVRRLPLGDAATIFFSGTVRPLQHLQTDFVNCFIYANFPSMIYFVTLIFVQYSTVLMYMWEHQITYFLCT